MKEGARSMRAEAGPPAFAIAGIMIISTFVGLILWERYMGWGHRCEAANEANAISALRTISSSQELYNTRYGSYGTLADLCEKNLIDSVLADAGTTPKCGYYFAMSVNGSTSWCCVTFPSTWGTTGDFKFRITQDGIIYRSEDDSTNEFPDGGTQLGM